MGELKFAKTFQLTDDSLDRSSQRVFVKGIDLSDFKRNPVMFYNHRRLKRWDELTSSKLPIGIWKNIRKVEGRLLADAWIDMADDFAKVVYDKVISGIIKAASVGIRPLAISDDPSDKVAGQKSVSFTKSLLLEASIVDIPDNSNSLTVDKSILEKSVGERTEYLKDKIAYITGYSVDDGGSINKDFNNLKNNNMTVVDIIKGWLFKSEDPANVSENKALENLVSKMQPAIDNAVQKGIESALKNNGLKDINIKKSVSEALADDEVKKSLVPEIDVEKSVSEALKSDDVQKSLGIQDLKDSIKKNSDSIVKYMGGKTTSGGDGGDTLDLDKGDSEEKFITEIDEDQLKELRETGVLS